MKNIFKLYFYNNTFWSFLLNIVIIVLLVSGFIYFTFNYYLPKMTRHGQSITVPRLIGQPIEKVNTVLSSLNLKSVITDTLYDEHYPEGTVIRQNPKYKQGVKYDRKIYLALSTQETAGLTIPNILYQSLKNARLLLVSKRLQLGKTSYISDMARDVVLKVIINGQKFQDYESLAKIRVKKGTAIDLVLGDGSKKEHITIPNLVGLSIDQAESELEKLDLSSTHEFIKATSPLQEVGEIIEQSPKAGHIIESIKTIQLKIVKNDSTN